MPSYRMDMLLGAGFVAPAFFWAGLGLASIPIIIHILNRRRFKVVPWAAMEFLLRAMRKNRRRLQFEQWILLAVRCLLLALLGAALAGPLACSDSRVAALAAQRSGLYVLVIDNSYSMAYDAERPQAPTHLDQAKLVAQRLIDKMAAGGESVVLITAGRPATAVIAKPTYDLDAARAAVGRIEQSYGSTDLAGALQLAIQAGREQSRQPRKHLHIFTDNTRSEYEGGQAAAILEAGKELPGIFGTVEYHNLGLADQWNQAVLEVEPVGSLVTTKFLADFSATVRGYGPQRAEGMLQWRLDDTVLAGGGQVALDVDTPPQLDHDIRVTTGGPHVLSATLAGGDPLGVDNTRWRVMDVASELKVLIVEGERGMGPMSSSGAYLDLALAPPRESGESAAPDGGQSDSPVAPELISDLELGNRVLGGYRAVILANVAAIQPAEADELERFVEGGGTLMMFMGPLVNGDNYNDVLLGRMADGRKRELLPGKLIKTVTAEEGSKYRSFFFNFNPEGVLHPMLDPFRGVSNSGLDTAQIFTYWQVALPAGSTAEHVLDYMPGPGEQRGDPAITVHTVGRGRVVFVSTSANGDWSNLYVKHNYVTLVHQLVYGSVSADDGWMNLTVGQRLELPPEESLTAAPGLVDSADRGVAMESVVLPQGATTFRSAPLERPGVYRLSTGSRTVPIAVNVPADEADVRTLGTAAVQKAMGDIPMDFLADAMPTENPAGQRGSDLSWWFMVGVLVLAGAECFMAMHYGHYRRK